MAGVVPIASGQTTGAQQPFFLGLGDLPGGTTKSSANGVSFDGSIVGGYATDANGQQAVAWRITPATPGSPASAQMIQLTPTTTPGAPGTAQAATVTPTGQVYLAGSYTAFDTNTQSTNTQAVRWQLNSDNSVTTVPLGYLAPQQAPYSFANGMTRDGTAIVGQSISVDPTTQAQDFRATYFRVDPTNNNAVTATALPNLPNGGGTQTLANAIVRTPTGDIVVGNGALNGGIGAARWKITDPANPASSATADELPNFLNHGSNPAEASGNALNSDGSRIAGYGLSADPSTSADRIEAGYWNAPPTGPVPPANEMAPEPAPNPSFDPKFESKALGISGNGDIIVGYGKVLDQASGQFKQEAFIYTLQDPNDPNPDPQANVMRSLKDVLITNFGLGDVLMNWELTEAFAVSEDGSSIVGLGKHTLGDGSVVDEAFFVTLPEPSGLLLLSVGGIALLRRRRAKRGARA